MVEGVQQGLVLVGTFFSVRIQITIIIHCGRIRQFFGRFQARHITFYPTICIPCTLQSI